MSSAVMGVHLAALVKGIFNLQVLSECVSGRETLHLFFYFRFFLSDICEEKLNRGEDVLAVNTLPVSSSGFDPSCFPYAPCCGDQRILLGDQLNGNFQFVCSVFRKASRDCFRGKRIPISTLKVGGNCPETLDFAARCAAETLRAVSVTSALVEREDHAAAPPFQPSA